MKTLIFPLIALLAVSCGGSSSSSSKGKSSSLTTKTVTSKTELREKVKLHTVGTDEEITQSNLVRFEKFNGMTKASIIYDFEIEKTQVLKVMSVYSTYQGCDSRTVRLKKLGGEAAEVNVGEDVKLESKGRYAIEVVFSGKCTEATYDMVVWLGKKSNSDLGMAFECFQDRDKYTFFYNYNPFVILKNGKTFQSHEKICGKKANIKTHYFNPEAKKDGGEMETGATYERNNKVYTFKAVTDLERGQINMTCHEGDDLFETLSLERCTRKVLEYK